MLLETLKVDNLEELKSEVGGLEDCFVKLAEPEEKLVAEVLESDLEVIRTALDNLIKFKEKDNKPYSAEFIAKERVVDDRGHKEKYIDVEFYDEENKVLSVNPLDKLSGGAKIYGKLAAITYVTPSGSKYVVYRLLDKDGKAIDTSSIAQESLSKFKKDNYTQILALMLEHKYPVKEKSEIAKDTDGKEMITTETITEDNMMVKTFLDYINKYKETRYDDSLQTAVLAYDELEKSVHGTLTVHLDPSGNVVVEAFDISDNLLSDIVGSLKSDINNEVKPAPRKDDDLAAFKLTLDGEFIQDYMMLAKPVKKDELLSIINNLCYRQCYGCIRLDKDGKLDFVTRKDKEFKDEMKLIENEENLYRDVFAKILEGVTITDDMRDKLREICTLSINNKLIKDFLASIAQHAQKGENLDDVKKIVTDWLNSDNKLLAGLKLEQEWQKKLEDEKGRG